MVSIPETMPVTMPVTPEIFRRYGTAKCVVEKKPYVPDKTANSLSKKRKHSSCFRRVHFQQDPSSRRVLRKCIYGRATLTNEEKKALWWDKQSLRASVRQSIRMFKSNEHCEGPSFEEFSQRYLRARELCGNSNSVGMEELQFNLSDSPVRGLEQKIFPGTVRARQDIIRKVVAAQDKLPSHLPKEQQSKLLRAASQNLTRGSRMIARLNGIGDAGAAALDRI
ncbi:hypothetical protein IV203_037284 [Nitzschia inconspicua]|uniref:Uncharacterized protein n=1 Tax=Nitzschia inconspicua TaxID=303405 RepID=A0A9K3LL66_9STRA|nr:hypothetical protein IV203_037284 [Nitzschia inconspicua]